MPAESPCDSLRTGCTLEAASGLGKFMVGSEVGDQQIEALLEEVRGDAHAASEASEPHHQCMAGFLVFLHEPESISERRPWVLRYTSCTAMNPPLTTKMHPLALLGLACSLVICCPLSSLFGVIAGWISLRAIDARPDRWRGRKVAILSIVLGLAMVPIQFLILNRIQAAYMDVVDDGLQTAVAAVFASPDEDAFRPMDQVFLRSSGRYPTEKEVRIFNDLVSEQLGRYRTTAIMQISEGEESLTGVQNIALFLTFDDGRTTTGGASCKLIPNSEDFSMELRLVRLEVTLPDGQTASLPARGTDPESVRDPEIGESDQ